MLQSYLHCAKSRFYFSFSLLDKVAFFERFVSYGIQRHYSCNCIVDTTLGSDNLVCFLVDMKAPRSPVYRQDEVSYQANCLSYRSPAELKRGEIKPRKIRNTHLSV